MTLDDLARLLGLIPAILDNQTKLLDRFDRLAAATPAQLEPELLSVRQYATRSSLSACTIRRRIADGTLAHVRLAGSIRIPSESLQPTSTDEIAAAARKARAGT